MGVVKHCEYWFQEEAEGAEDLVGGFGKRTRKVGVCGGCIAQGTRSPCASPGLFVSIL